MKVRVQFCWYDAWIGLYWDRAKRRLYICPVPFVAIMFQCRETEVQRGCEG